MQRIIQRLQHKWRIRMVMTIMMIIAITLTSVTFTTVNWFEAKTLLLNAATSKAEMTSQITEQKVQQIIDPAEAHCPSGCDAWRPLLPICMPIHY